MKLLIESVMVFFGTLMAAAVVALGDPAGAELDIVKSAIQSHEPVAQTSAAPANKRNAH